MEVESLHGRCKEEEIIQKCVEMEMRKVDVGLDRLGDAVESPRRYGEAKRKELEDIYQAIHHEGQVHVARPFHRDMVKGILEVHRTASHRFHYASGNVGNRLHLERGLDQDLVE